MAPIPLQSLPVPPQQIQLDPRDGASLHVPPGALWPPTWPMGLTMLRLLLLPVFLWLLILDAGPQQGRVNPHRWWALAVFATMAITDKLDGYLARKLNQTSRLGTILDPVADKLLVASSLILLSSQWIAAPGYRIPLYVVAAVYAKDLLVVIGALALLYTLGRVAVKPRPLGKLGTFLQLVLVILTLIAPDLDRMLAGVIRPLLTGLEWVVAAVAILSAGDYLRQGVRQYREGSREKKKLNHGGHGEHGERKEQGEQM